VTQSRPYVSPKREAQAAATREAILQAFAEQLSDPDRAALSPSEAAHRAGVSVRTVHMHFPNADDQIIALGEWFDRQFHPAEVRVADGPDDLARYFHDIHQNALKSPLTRALATAPSPVWREVRYQRRAARLDAIRKSVAAIGAPRRATEDATATLLGLLAPKPHGRCTTTACRSIGSPTPSPGPCSSSSTTSRLPPRSAARST